MHYRGTHVGSEAAKDLCTDVWEKTRNQRNHPKSQECLASEEHMVMDKKRKDKKALCHAQEEA
jgi:hypothetical protein